MLECCLNERIIADGSTDLHELSVAVLSPHEQEGVALVVLTVDREVGIQRVFQPLQTSIPCLRNEVSQVEVARVGVLHT